VIAFGTQEDTPVDISEEAKPGSSGCGLADGPENTTQWDLIGDPAHVIKRYEPAIRRYFLALIRNRDDAEEAAQEFFLRIVRAGFAGACRDRGRFRDYLRKAVRNAAMNYLRSRRGQQIPALPEPAPPGAGAHAEEARECRRRRVLLKLAFRALARHEQTSPGNLCYTVLCAIAKAPADSCLALAERVSRQTGRPLTAAAFRKQVSRARRLLASLLVEEVSGTLDLPTPARVRQELVALGLWDRVRPYLSSRES
jgi:RNA polymerase sigma-70 factor (ECF subfamily)